MRVVQPHPAQILQRRRIEVTAEHVLHRTGRDMTPPRDVGHATRYRHWPRCRKWHDAAAPGWNRCGPEARFRGDRVREGAPVSPRPEGGCNCQERAASRVVIGQHGVLHVRGRCLSTAGPMLSTGRKLENRISGASSPNVAAGLARKQPRIQQDRRGVRSSVSARVGQIRLRQQSDLVLTRFARQAPAMARDPAFVGHTATTLLSGSGDASSTPGAERRRWVRPPWSRSSAPTGWVPIPC